MRILVVDDNPTVRHYYRSILEQESGWVYDEARTGEEALQRIETSQPDVVLLDFRMPDINGIDLAREIIRRWPAIPILLVSVHFSKQLAVAARAAGIQGACAKSDIGSIVEAVKTVLHKETYFPDETAGKTAVL